MIIPPDVILLVDLGISLAAAVGVLIAAIYAGKSSKNSEMASENSERAVDTLVKLKLLIRFLSKKERREKYGGYSFSGGRVEIDARASTPNSS